MRENEQPTEDVPSSEILDSGPFRATRNHGDPSPSSIRLLGGRYEVQEEIGSGAFSITYRGLDKRLGRTVAIKILRREYALDPTYIQRFEREARAAAAVSHQNVVDVYDYGQHGELLYIVMQYVEGEDLKHLITREGPLPPRRAARIARDVLAGLAAIHEAGIIHRDIKPQNVLIGLHGVARVADFGIAHGLEDGGLTSVGTTMGSASYMAPEQAQAGDLTAATDLYAVGVVLYEMLTSQLPFNAPTAVGLMIAHIQASPLPPSQAAPAQQIPPALDRLVMRALEKQPQDRFASATAMRRELAVAMDASEAHSMATQTAMAAGSPTVALPELHVRDMRQSSTPIRPRSGGKVGTDRRWVRPLLFALLPLLLLGGALAGTWSVLNDDEDTEMDFDGAPLVAISSPAAPEDLSTATETMLPGDVAVTAAETEVEATEAPTVTLAPTLVPTDTPEPTDAPIPTDTPVPTPTETLAPTPTPESRLPAGEPIRPIEPVGAPVGESEDAVEDEAQLALVDEQGNTQQIQRIGAGDNPPTVSEDAVSTQEQTLNFAASDWQGAYYQSTGNLQPWSALYAQSAGYGAGTIRLNLQGDPTSGTATLTVQGMTSENWSSLPMAIRVNGQEVFSGNSPFATWNGVDGQQPWTSVSFDLPADTLQQGENTITFVNRVEQGAFSLPPYILLAEGTLTVDTPSSGE
jgi:serine/threonine protein kinase/outer membrane biosynthesis protein TonB